MFMNTRRSSKLRGGNCRHKNQRAKVTAEEDIMVSAQEYNPLGSPINIFHKHVFVEYLTVCARQSYPAQHFLHLHLLT